MVIVERTDYTLIIKKEGTDEYKGSFIQLQKEYGNQVKVFCFSNEYTGGILKAKEALFGEDILVLYFSKAIYAGCRVGVRVAIKVGFKWFGDEDSGTF
jgi:hypothetical protein